MTSYKLRLLVSLILCGLTLALWYPPGIPLSFTCDITNFDNLTNLDWELHTQTSTIRMVQCLKTICYFNTDLYSATMTSTALAHSNVLTINDVSTSQNNTTWTCIAYYSKGDPEHKYFYLNVYDADEIPQCGNVAAVGNCQIQVTCVILTYKYGTDFKYDITANTTTERLIDGNINIVKEKLNSTGYYKITFNFTVLAADLGPGTHSLRIQITPINKSGVTFISPYTRTFKIDYPRAFLANDCPKNDEIKENSSYCCTCYNNITSILPTTVSWSQDNTKLLTNETLYFTAIRSEKYKCKISNCLNWIVTSYFEPRITLNPTSTDSSNSVALSVGTIVGIVIAGIVLIASLVCIRNLVIHCKTTDPNHFSDVKLYEAPEKKTVSTIEHLTIVHPDVNAYDSFTKPYDEVCDGETSFQRETKNDPLQYNTTRAANPYCNSDVNPYEAPVIKPTSFNETVTTVPAKGITSDTNV